MTEQERVLSREQQLYLDLLKRVLTRYGFDRDTARVRDGAVATALGRLGLELHRKHSVDLTLRRDGRDWPADAETMVGLDRLDNLEACIADIVASDVPGDLVETGVWRGGASIFMRAALEVLGDRHRQVWVADSFEGLPRPDADRYPADAGDTHWRKRELAVSLDDVKSNFERYGFLDDRVHFLKGWFKDTLPTAPIERLCLVRLDGDMYGSTIEALEALYPKLSVGGYVVVDDYGYAESCRRAVDDYRARMNIVDEIHRVDWTGAYWRRSEA